MRYALSGAAIAGEREPGRGGMPEKGANGLCLRFVILSSATALAHWRVHGNSHAL